LERFSGANIRLAHKFREDVSLGFRIQQILLWGILNLRENPWLVARTSRGFPQVGSGEFRKKTEQGKWLGA
jgi:hypothetical protein